MRRGGVGGNRVRPFGVDIVRPAGAGTGALVGGDTLLTKWGDALVLWLVRECDALYASRIDPVEVPDAMDSLSVPEEAVTGGIKCAGEGARMLPM